MPRVMQSKRVELLAEKVMEWGNLVFVGFVVGQLVPGATPIRWGLLLLGVCAMMGAYIVANQMMRGVIRS